jgi:Ca2+-binding EF-hand superfamily protein
LDGDNIGVIMYSNFENQLALRGFHDQDALNLVWKHVDLNQSGSLDFSEFLSLMFLWAEVGDYESILQSTAAAELVKDAFNALQENWMSYDNDKNRKFDYDELCRFMAEKLPSIMQYSKPIIDKCFPASEVEAGGQLSFPRFMHLLYCCFQEHPDRASGKIYVATGTIKHEIGKRMAEVTDGGMLGNQSLAWVFLSGAFVVLEKDFSNFDKDNNGYIDYKELTIGVPSKEGAARFDVISRLEFIFDMVDLDRSKSIDFYEFLYLVFVTTRDGSYSDLVEGSSGHSQVGLALVHLHSTFNSTSTSSIEWLRLADVERFCTAEFGLVPEALGDIYGRVACALDAGNQEPVIDFLRFIRLLYFLTVPKGRYHYSAYAPSKRPQNEAELLVSIAESKVPSAQARISPVYVSHFQKSKMLGKGTCGVVYLGVYDCRVMAAKFMRDENPTPTALQDLENEVRADTRPGVLRMIALVSCGDDVCIKRHLCQTPITFVTKDVCVKRR